MPAKVYNMSIPTETRHVSKTHRDTESRLTQSDTSLQGHELLSRPIGDVALRGATSVH